MKEESISFHTLITQKGKGKVINSGGNVIFSFITCVPLVCILQDRLQAGRQGPCSSSLSSPVLSLLIPTKNLGSTRDERSDDKREDRDLSVISSFTHVGTHTRKRHCVPSERRVRLFPSLLQQHRRITLRCKSQIV